MNHDASHVGSLHIEGVRHVLHGIPSTIIDVLLKEVECFSSLSLFCLV